MLTRRYRILQFTCKKSYLCKVTANKPLFHTAVECEHHQESLVRRIPPVLEGSDNEVEGEFAILVVIVFV